MPLTLVVGLVGTKVSMLRGLNQELQERLREGEEEGRRVRDKAADREQEVRREAGGRGSRQAGGRESRQVGGRQAGWRGEVVMDLGWRASASLAGVGRLVLSGLVGLRWMV